MAGSGQAAAGLTSGRVPERTALPAWDRNQAFRSISQKQHKDFPPQYEKYTPLPFCSHAF